MFLETVFLRIFHESDFGSLGSVSHACSVFLPVSLLCNARFESIVMSVDGNNVRMSG
jgi:hypothetical protein